MSDPMGASRSPGTSLPRSASPPSTGWPTPPATSPPSPPWKPRSRPPPPWSSPASASPWPCTAPPRDPRPHAEPGLRRRQRVHERDRGRTRLAEPGHLGPAPRRLRPGQRHPHRRRPRPGPRPPPPTSATPLAILGGLLLWLLRLALAPASTLSGFRAWVLDECPVAPGRRAPKLGPAPHRTRGRRPRPPGSWIWSPNGMGLAPAAAPSPGTGAPVSAK